MRALRKAAPEPGAELVPVPVPAPGPGEVLIQVEAATHDRAKRNFSDPGRTPAVSSGGKSR